MIMVVFVLRLDALRNTVSASNLENLVISNVGVLTAEILRKEKSKSLNQFKYIISKLNVTVKNPNALISIVIVCLTLDSAINTANVQTVLIIDE